MSEELMDSETLEVGMDGDESADAIDPIASLRARLLESILPAIETLARAGRGEQVFRTVEQMRSCFTLARLAQVVLLDTHRVQAYEQANALTPIQLTDEQVEAFKHLEYLDRNPAQPGNG
jgi:hypothetical protein